MSTWKVLIAVIFFLTLLFASVDPILAAKLDDPLNIGENNKGIQIVVGRFLKGLLGISGVVVLLMFVLGGFQLLTSAGDKKKYQQGTTTLWWAAVGILTVFGSYAIVEFLLRSFISG